MVLDIPAIKEENKSIYEMICKLTDYFEEKKFNLSINQRKSCYTFKRIYDELADIIPKKNNEYCINTFDSIKLNLEKLNDFFQFQFLMNAFLKINYLIKISLKIIMI